MELSFYPAGDFIWSVPPERPLNRHNRHPQLIKLPPPSGSRRINLLTGFLVFCQKILKISLRRRLTLLTRCGGLFCVSRLASFVWRGWPLLCIHAFFFNDMGIGALACTVFIVGMSYVSHFSMSYVSTLACLMYLL